MTNQENIAFLFGSGISLEAGLPKCSEMTTEILAGETISRGPSGERKIEQIYCSKGERYQIGKPAAEQGLQRPQPVDERILLFLQVLKAEADIYLYGKGPANYEDLFHMVWQIYGSKTGQLRCPAVNPLIQKLDRKFNKLYGDDQIITEHERDYGGWRNRSHRIPIPRLEKLAKETHDYIRGYVYARLSKDHPDAKYFKEHPAVRDSFIWICDAARAPEYGDKFFFTLNNDVLLERLFRSEGIRFDDGFPMPCEEDLDRGWEFGAFERGPPDESRVVIAKLHGSINWFISKQGIISRLPSGPLEESRFVSRFPFDQIEAEKKLTGPLILVGADNKEADYNKPVFEELHQQFYSALKKLKHLIVCGYGFGDNAINLRLLSWLYRSKENKMVLIHKTPHECLEPCALLLHAWKSKDKRLINVENFIGDETDPITWKKILGRLRA